MHDTRVCVLRFTPECYGLPPSVAEFHKFDGIVGVGDIPYGVMRFELSVFALRDTVHVCQTAASNRYKFQSTSEERLSRIFYRTQSTAPTFRDPIKNFKFT